MSAKVLGAFCLGNEHGEVIININIGTRDVFRNGIQKVLNSILLALKVLNRPSILGRRINGRILQLLVFCVQIAKQIENLRFYLFHARRWSIHLVYHNQWL